MNSTYNFILWFIIGALIGLAIILSTGCTPTSPTAREISCTKAVLDWKATVKEFDQTMVDSPNLEIHSGRDTMIVLGVPSVVSKIKFDIGARFNTVIMTGMGTCISDSGTLWDTATFRNND